MEISCNKWVLLVFLALWLESCNQQEINYSEELTKIKEAALKTLSEDVQEFNNYPDRPASDGHLNASNNEAFLQDNIPLFLASNEDFTEVYNYRWWMISKHLKAYHAPDDGQDYWVFTEFFGLKGWASRSGAIVCPAGHQFYDTRWLRDPQYLQSYAEYYLGGSGFKMNQRENRNFLTYISHPESHHYSSWMVDGTEAFLKVHPNDSWRDQMLPHLESHQEVWDSIFTVKAKGAKTDGMYKFLDLYDGMEFSIGAAMGLVASKDDSYGFITEENWRDYYLGWNTTNQLAESEHATNAKTAFRSGYAQLYLVRPTLNLYSYGNLQAMSNLYSLAGNATKSKAYQQKANSLQSKILNVLWNDEDQFFNSYTAGDNQHGIQDHEVRVRESVGYTPWYFNLVPKNEEKYAEAWKFLGSTAGFNHTKGMTTAEIDHPYYNEQAYAWNGRGWPFQNSVVNKAYANYLKNYKSEVTNSDRQLLYDLMEKLVDMHGDQRNIGEWYIPSNGEQFGGVKDYFHSTFPDMLIEDLLGFTADHENKFTIQCLLLEAEWDYFYLGNIRYHGHDVDIVWKQDWGTETAGQQSQLVIWVDGVLVAQSEHLHQKLVIELS